MAILKDSSFSLNMNTSSVLILSYRKLLFKFFNGKLDDIQNFNEIQGRNLKRRSRIQERKSKTEKEI